MTDSEQKHHILHTLDADKVGKIQVRNVRNEVLADFAGVASIESIRDTIARMKGEGEYSVVALDVRGKQMKGAVKLTVAPDEVPLSEDELIQGDASAVVATKALSYANREAREREARLEREQDRIRAERAALDKERQSTFREMMHEHREAMREVEQRDQRRRDQLHTEYSVRMEALNLESERQKQDYETRMRALDIKERELQRNHEQAMAQIRSRELELLEREHEQESRAADEKLEIQFERLRAENDIRIKDIERKAQASTTYSKSVMDEYARALIRQKFPEPSAFDEFMRQAAPIINMVGGVMANPGVPTPGTADVMEIGGLPPEPEFPEPPKLEDLGPPIPLPPSARPNDPQAGYGAPPLPPSASGPEYDVDQAGDDALEF